MPRDMYRGLRDWLLDFAMQWGLGFDTNDGADLGTLERSVRPRETRLVWSHPLRDRSG